MAEEKLKRDLETLRRESELVGVLRLSTDFTGVQREFINEGKLDARSVNIINDMLDEATKRANKRIKEEYD